MVKDIITLNLAAYYDNKLVAELSVRGYRGEDEDNIKKRQIVIEFYKAYKHCHFDEDIDIDY